jgi:REP element-mobilizing transposase RayT
MPEMRPAVYSFEYKGTGLLYKWFDGFLFFGELYGMRMARLKVSTTESVGVYHCVSRVVDRRFVLGELEKDHFLGLLRECAEFCEVEVLTFCLMSNHFHLLVEVPKRPEVLPTMDQILGKLERLSGHQNVGAVRQRLAAIRSVKNQVSQEAEEALRQRYLSRMWDLSAFMKLLKQRFTQWYNARMERQGTLWEERFKSVMVESVGSAVGAMAAYIDLNPVRARLVKDPKDYRWSGYGQAVSGHRIARRGLQRVVLGLQRGKEASPSRSLEIYRTYVYQQGSEERESLNSEGQTVRGALSREDVLKVIREQGRLPLNDYLHCRVRYFCDGAVFGSREYVNGVFEEFRHRLGPKRKDGARRIKGLNEKLYTLRNLRMAVFG